MLQWFSEEAFARRNPPTFLMIQDPPIITGNIPSVNVYKCLHPRYDLGRTRVATFVLSSFTRSYQVFSLSTTRCDLLEVLAVSEGGLFSPAISQLRLLNIYCVPRTSTVHSPPINPQIVFGQAGYPSIVAGDFNLHHLSADPTRLLSDKEFREADPFFSLAWERGCNLLNTPGVYTRLSFTSDARPGVLDLTFASTGLHPFVEGWSTPFSSTGSDYVPVQISLSAKSLTPPRPVPDWDRTHWNEAEDDLRNFVCPPPPPIVTLATLDT